MVVKHSFVRVSFAALRQLGADVHGGFAKIGISGKHPKNDVLPAIQKMSSFVAVIKTYKIMYSSDFEHLFIRYKVESMPYGKSI